MDDFSRFTWLCALRQKSEFPAIFRQFQVFVENQFDRKIKVFQSDGGTEFTNNMLKSLFRDSGIQHCISCPYTPSQNGRAERKHRHITETGLAMLFHSRVPVSYWVDAFSTEVYTINRLPSKLLGDKSTFELLFGVSPNYENFHPFGCCVYPCLRDYVANKFSPAVLRVFSWVIAPCIRVFVVSIYRLISFILLGMHNLMRNMFHVHRFKIRSLVRLTRPN